MLWSGKFFAPPGFVLALPGQKSWLHLCCIDIEGTRLSSEISVYHIVEPRPSIPMVR